MLARSVVGGLTPAVESRRVNAEASRVCVAGSIARRRGAGRPANFAGVTRCDMGAFELQRTLALPLLLR